MDSHLLVGLFHIFAVVPLFLYVALNRVDTASGVYTFLLVLGAFVLLYHSFKAWRRFIAGSSAVWINMLHVFLIAPLMIYIGYKGKDTPRYAYELLALVAFAALGYHTYHLIVSMNVLMDEKK